MPDDLACPVCDAPETSGDELRVHLMVEHRKSDLTDLLVDGVGDSRDAWLTA